MMSQSAPLLERAAAAKFSAAAAVAASECRRARRRRRDSNYTKRAVRLKSPPNGALDNLDRLVLRLRVLVYE